MTLMVYVFAKLQTLKDVARQMLKSLVSDDPSSKILVNEPKHYSNVRDMIFIIYINHSKRNWVGKLSLTYM